MASSTQPTSSVTNFLSLNHDVAGIIAEHLPLKDIKALAEASIEIAGQLEASVPMTRRQLAYQSSVEMLSIIRFLVPKVALGGINLDTDPIDWPYAQHVRLLQIFNSSISCDPSTRFAGISADNLGWILHQVAVEGRTEIFNSLMTCARFVEIPANWLRVALENAVENGHTEIVKSLIACPRFLEISDDKLKEISTVASGEIKAILETAIRLRTRKRAFTEEDAE